MKNKLKLFRELIDKKQLDGTWVGVVVDNSDTGYKDTGKPIYRVRVSIPNLTDGIPSDKLPWYMVAQPPLPSFNSLGRTPHVGSKVLVQFDNNNIYNGIVIGLIPNTPPNPQ